MAGGNIYVGEWLPAVYGGLNGDTGAVEASLINPELDAKPSSDVISIPYWPEYIQIHPFERAAYLEWLAGGRLDPQVPLGLAFLYFYGLERRILFDPTTSSRAREERPTLLDEIRRLQDMFGAQGSFASYSESLMDTVGALESAETGVIPEKPTYTRYTWELSPSLLVALSLFASQKRALSVDWAHALVVASPQIRGKMALMRCKREFLDLFSARYSAKYGEGLSLTSSSTPMSINYQPASPSFPRPYEIRLASLMGVKALQSITNKLIDLAYHCTEDLTPYGRHIGRDPEKASSLVSVSLLPQELLTHHLEKHPVPLLAFLLEALDGKQRVLVKADCLTKLIKEEGSEDVSRRDMGMVLGLLEKRGIGIEPDFRFGGPLFTSGEKVCVFRFTDGSPEAMTKEYGADLIYLRLAAMAAGADGEIAESEMVRLREHINAIPDLSLGAKERLGAHLDWLLGERDFGLRGIKRQLAELPSKHRDSIASLCVAVAAIDGEASQKEVRVLERIFGLLDVPKEDLYSALHASMGSAAQDHGPVPVIEADPVIAGHRIPRQGEGAGGNVDLDEERIRRKLVETANIRELLSKVFTEEPAGESPQAEAVSGRHEGNTEETGTVGLGRAYVLFLREFVRKPNWDRAEAEALSSHLGLMLEGAIESVNDWSLEYHGDVLVEGDDPLTINEGVRKGLQI